MSKIVFKKIEPAKSDLTPESIELGINNMFYDGGIEKDPARMLVKITSVLSRVLGQAHTIDLSNESHVNNLITVQFHRINEPLDLATTKVEIHRPYDLKINDTEKSLITAFAKDMLGKVSKEISNLEGADKKYLFLQTLSMAMGTMSNLSPFYVTLKSTGKLLEIIDHKHPDYLKSVLSDAFDRAPKALVSNGTDFIGRT